MYIRHIGSSVGVHESSEGIGTLRREQVYLLETVGPLFFIFASPPNVLNTGLNTNCPSRIWPIAVWVTYIEVRGTA